MLCVLVVIFWKVQLKEQLQAFAVLHWVWRFQMLPPHLQLALLEVLPLILQHNPQYIETGTVDVRKIDYGRVVSTGLQTGIGASIPALKSSTGAPLPSLKGGKADVFGTALI